MLYALELQTVRVEVAHTWRTIINRRLPSITI